LPRVVIIVSSSRLRAVPMPFHHDRAIRERFASGTAARPSPASFFRRHDCRALTALAPSSLLFYFCELLPRGLTRFSIPPTCGCLILRTGGDLPFRHLPRRQCALLDHCVQHFLRGVASVGWLVAMDRCPAGSEAPGTLENSALTPPDTNSRAATDRCPSPRYARSACRRAPRRGSGRGWAECNCLSRRGR
jgi:hypothetical protein